MVADKCINKSGRRWKLHHKQRFKAIRVKANARSFEERRADKEEIKAIRALEESYKADEREARRVAAEKRRQKSQRKKEQQLLHSLKTSQGVQMVKDPRKIHKLTYKIRRDLFKLSPEQLQRMSV